jgi:hypothetical protein
MSSSSKKSLPISFSWVILIAIALIVSMNYFFTIIDVCVTKTEELAGNLSSILVAIYLLFGYRDELIILQLSTHKYFPHSVF